MDPDVALDRLREVFSDWEDERGDGTRVSLEDVVSRLDDARDLFAGLDEWLSQGGFVPKAWSRKASTSIRKWEGK